MQRSRLRFVVPTRRGAVLGAAFALTQLVVGIAALARCEDCSAFTVAFALGSPFLSFLIISAIGHQRTFDFDRSTKTLTVRERILLVPVRRKSVIPFSQLTAVRVRDRLGGDGQQDGSVLVQLDNDREVEVCRPALEEANTSAEKLRRLLDNVTTPDDPLQ